MGEKLTRTQRRTWSDSAESIRRMQTFSRRQFAAQVGGYTLRPAERSPGACCFAIAGEWKASSRRHPSG